MSEKVAKALEAPGRLDPPVVGKVTHHSIELYWRPPLHNGEAGPLSYTIEDEAQQTTSSIARSVYHGSEERCVCNGLQASKQYRFILRAANNVGAGPWSPPVTVSTTRHSQTSALLHKAVVKGDSAAVKTIIEAERQYLEATDSLSLSPLMSACRHGRTSVVKVLLEAGADVEYKNSAHKTSLMEACYYGHVDCVRLLVAAGALWTARDTSGMSALHWAVDGGQCEVITMALAEGVAVDDKDSSTISGWTPLLRTAALTGNTAVARVLIRHGADVSQSDKDGKTVLMLAALNGYSELAQLLISNGADPTAHTEYGKTAMDFALSFEREETIPILRAAMAV